MPSTYAHYRFGKRVLARLPEAVRRAVEPCRALYDIGLHGPDVLFHYRAFAHNAVNGLGHAMHDRSGRSFFAQALPAADSDAAQAYLYGFLCHFALDSTCHGLINRTVEQTGISHNDVESELERALMLRDGLDPARHLPAGHFAPSRNMGEVIARFFPGVTDSQAEQAVRAMKRNLNLLVVQSPLKRWFIRSVLRAAGQYDALYGLVIKEQPNPALADVTAELVEMGERAEDTALRLILESVDRTLLSDEQLALDFNSRRREPDKEESA